MFTDLYNFLYQLGQHSMEHIWFPVLVWTLLSFAVYLVLHYSDKLNPLYHYHLRVATILALPAGIMMSVILQHGISGLNAEQPIETAFFVVSNPIQATLSQGSGTTAGTFPMDDPNLWIGFISVLLILTGVFLLLRLIIDLYTLRKLTAGLSLYPIEDFGKKSSVYASKQIHISFHDNPYVPFTYGWNKPVVVLPERLKGQPEKMDMALNHELVHIQRNDYLLQMVLTVMESIFWFHPLVRITSKEIDTYREISCDQQVLNEANYSVKSYANLLLELLPLQSGMGRLSVSMAVKESTLKQRIKTMKHHKMHRSSLRQSMIFLILMTLGITLPIACSDMRGPQGLTEEEILATTFSFEKFTIDINGVKISDFDTKVTSKGTNGIVYAAGEYGSFVFSPKFFEGSEKAGQIEGNTATFTINEMTVTVKSSASISGEKLVPLYARHFTSDKLPVKFQVFTEIPRGTLDSDQLSDIATLKLIPPPPPPSPPDAANIEEDFFVVVEQMPEIIGGMKSIQSKIQYPEMAKRAGIEGRVIVQFIVNENGDVEEPRIVRGIGGGADEEALRVIRETTFKPGMQRGRNVRVQFSLPIVFRLADSDFGSSNNN